MQLLRQFAVLGSVLVLGSCASIREVQVPPERFFQKGFSFMPLNEKGWLIAARNPQRAVLVKRGDNPDETHAIEATAFSGQSPTLESGEGFARLIREFELKNTDPARFKVLKHDVSPYAEKGNNCVRSHMAAEDHGVVSRSGRTGPMILEKLTLVCVHPMDNRAGANVAYSQRYYPDQRDPKLLEKGTSILSSVEFTDL